MGPLDFSKITKDHIEKAIADIDRNGIKSTEQSRYYDLIYNGKTYPPKLVISLCGKYAFGSEIPRTKFSGGIGTPSFNCLTSHGFVIHKKGETDSTLVDIFRTVMNRSNNVRSEILRIMKLVILFGKMQKNRLVKYFCF